MESSFLSSVVLPLCLATIMFGMGLSLLVSDFIRVFTSPKATLIGISCQILVLPILAFLLALVFRLDSQLALGLIILSLSPGAVTSNLFTFLAGGNLALSISLTALVSFITPFTMPFLFLLAVKFFASDHEIFSLPLTQTVLSLIGITIVPVIFGMITQRFFPLFAKKCEGPTKIISTSILFLIVVGLLKKHWEIVPSSFGQVGLVCLLFNVFTTLVGYGFARLNQLSSRDSITIGIEAGFQNSALALFIASTLLDDGRLAIIPAVYSLVMFLTGIVIISVLRQKKNVRETLQVIDNTESC